MKIAVVCANGKAGSLIVREAVERGLDVTAVVRSENQSATQQVIQKDLFHLKASDLTGFDVVIDAFGTWTLETLPQHSTSLNHLCNILSGQDTRLLVVGGARQFICKPRAHRAGHGRGRFPGRIQAAGLSYGKSPGRSSDQKRCEMDLHQPCWGFSARRSKNWKIYSGRGGIGPKCQRGKRYQLCRLCDCCGR